MMLGEALGVGALGQLNTDHTLAAGAGALPLSGVGATLSVTMPAAAGALPLSGASVLSVTMSASFGALPLAGSAVLVVGNDKVLIAGAGVLPLAGSATLTVTAPATVAAKGGFAGLPLQGGVTYSGPPIKITAEQARILSPELVDRMLEAECGRLSLTGKPARLWTDDSVRKRRIRNSNAFVLADGDPILASVLAGEKAA
jgi:hypothetical protein